MEGLTISPRLAKAEKARTICSGVTAISWPMGTEVTE